MVIETAVLSGYNYHVQSILETPMTTNLRESSLICSLIAVV
jgi:hypothetical protein